MVQENFPWLRRNEDKPKELEVSEGSDLKTKVLLQLKKHQEILFLLILALGLGLSYGIFVDSKRSELTRDNPQENRSDGVPVLMLMLPLAKGEALVPEAIKIVSVKINSITKHQRLQLLGETDLEKLTGRLVAKKDLSSSRPLFWSDIMIQKANHNLPQRNQIIFSKE